MDSYEKAALAYFGKKELNELKELDFLKFAPYKDRIEIAVRVATSVLREDVEFVDSYRAFPVHMEKEYQKFLSHCCCGFYDERLTTCSGNLYYIGFNYGH